MHPVSFSFSLSLFSLVYGDGVFQKERIEPGSDRVIHIDPVQCTWGCFPSEGMTWAALLYAVSLLTPTSTLRWIPKGNLTVLRSFVVNFNLSYIYFLFRHPPNINLMLPFLHPKKRLSRLKVLFPVDSSCVGGRRDPKRGTRTSGGVAVPSRSSPFHSIKGI